MILSEQVAKDLIAAMKAKEATKLDALRAMKTAFTLAKSEKGSGSGTKDKSEKKSGSGTKDQRDEKDQSYPSARCFVHVHPSCMSEMLQNRLCDSIARYMSIPLILLVLIL